MVPAGQVLEDEPPAKVVTEAVQPSSKAVTQQSDSPHPSEFRLMPSVSTQEHEAEVMKLGRFLEDVRFK